MDEAERQALGSGRPGDSPIPCTHCGLVVPPSLIAPLGQPSFCCSGCKTVYRMITASGLGRYYELQALDPSQACVPANPHQSTYQEFDDPSFAVLHTRSIGEHCSVEFYLEGVHCSACVWLVEKLPDLLAGVISVRLDIGRSVAAVVYDPTAIALSKIGMTLDGFGYPPHPFRSAERRERARQQDRKLLLRLGVAGAAAGNAMLMAIALYAGASDDPDLSRLFRGMSLAVSLPTVLWAGQSFFAGAWAGLRARMLHIDVPVSIALIGATVSSTVHTVTGRGHVYFDSVTMLMFLLLAARYVQMRALRAASDASDLLFSLTPAKAHLLGQDGTYREVPVESIMPGQVIEVLAGEGIPTDGVILSGASRLDRSLLTGESIPVDVGVSDEVHAGAQNLAARLRVRVTQTGEHTRVGRLIRAVEEAQRRRAPIVMLADRIASGFVVAILGLAALSAALWWSYGADVVVDRVIAMLVVTCPCALGLATPLAVAHALGSAARDGIFIKGADTVESLAKIHRVFLDKTGTLTQGRVMLVRAEGDSDAIHRAAALEAHSSHLFARAMLEAYPQDVQRHEIRDTIDTAGAGLVGTVDGHKVLVGTSRHLRNHGLAVSEAWDLRTDAVADDGYSPVLVAEDGAVRALLSFGDPLRVDSVEAVSELKRLGLLPSIISGDHPSVVRRVARDLSLEVAKSHGSVSPEGKTALVESMMRSGIDVAMIGDGVNDAGALAAARVGIAVRGGADVSLATADVFLTRPGLRPAVDLVRGCRATLAVIHRNLGISLVYNALGIALALAGWITPLVAAVLMPLSSLSVVLSSVLSRPFRRHEPKALAATSPITTRQVPA